MIVHVYTNEYIYVVDQVIILSILHFVFSLPLQDRSISSQISVPKSGFSTYVTSDDSESVIVMLSRSV